MSLASSLFSAAPLSLPAHCTPTTPFLVELSSYLQTCVPTQQALLSSTLGTLSIVSWLFAQIPQIYKNHKIQSTAGLSIFFLAEWCLGDMANLLGALFTNQANWQVVVAAYYVFVDVCLVWQFFWYTYIKPSMDGQSLHSSDDRDRQDLNGDDDDSINGLSPLNSSFRDDFPFEPSHETTEVEHSSTPFLISAPRSSGIRCEMSPAVTTPSSSASSWIPSPSPRTMLYVSTSCALFSRANAAPLPRILVNSMPVALAAQVESSTMVAGKVLAWASTFLYLGSRFPQLYHNFARKSTAGLSPLLFFAAFCGNLFYSSSLITNPNGWSDLPPYGGHGWAGPDGSNRWEWVNRAAPFWLGAAGVLTMDGMVGMQCIVYGDRTEEKIVKVRDSRGWSRWERVSGWMRGWVPIVRGKEEIVGLAESQRLIRESHEWEWEQSGSRSSRYGTL
jgi:solute carrier family 66 (lysosomal lysine-arginine transporter), member 1